VPDMTGSIVDDDLFAPNVIADPYSYYGHLRENDPVHWNALHEVWIVTRYDDVTWLTRHPRIFSSSVPQKDPRDPYPPINPDDWDDFQTVRSNMTGRIITTDRPPHRDQRAALHSYFTPAMMERWRPMVRSAVADLIDAADNGGRMDVMNDVAIPLPLMVISELMAIPKADRPYVRSIAEKMLVGPLQSPSRMHDVATSMAKMDEYITPIVEERFANPGDDLISVLLLGEKAGAFTREQVMRNIAFFVVAGHETSINLICNGLLAFIRNPAQWELLRTAPSDLAVSATEECLRFDPPVPSIERIATEDVTLRDKEIKELDRVRWSIAAANRDPRRFAEPDDFDITRNPNPHIAFGHGIHMCLGMSLARLEGQEVFAAMAPRFPELRLETKELEYAPAIHIRSLRALEVSW